MSAILSVSERVVGGGRLTDGSKGLLQSVAFGGSLFPSRLWQISNGTGNGEANQWYVAERTCPASGNDNLDLAGSLSNPVTGTITFANIKRILIRLLAPDGTAKLRIGPQGVSNAAQLWFGALGATIYNEVFEELDVKNQFGGWAITGGTADILGISNPGGSDVNYAIWIIGKQ